MTDRKLLAAIGASLAACILYAAARVKPVRLDPDVTVLVLPGPPALIDPTARREAEYLRALVAATCKPDGFGPRAKLPDPPPGWPRVELPETSGAWGVGR